jgi:type VI secretion system lysozyme-like protein
MEHSRHPSKKVGTKRRTRRHKQASKQEILGVKDDRLFESYLFDKLAESVERTSQSKAQGINYTKTLKTAKEFIAWFKSGKSGLRRDEALHVLEDQYGLPKSKAPPAMRDGTEGFGTSTYGFRGDSRGMSLAEFSEAVRRELKNLFNTHGSPRTLSLRANSDGPDSGDGSKEEDDVTADFPYASRSVLCYGMPDTTGMFQSADSQARLSEMIRRAIGTFEPRVEAESLRVELVEENQPERPGVLLETSIGAYRFRVTARLIVEPAPEEKRFTVEVRPGDGKIEVL